MCVVYVTEQGVSLKKSSKRILISRDDKPIQEIRLHEVERMVLFGNIQISTQAMKSMMSEGIEVSFMSTNGKFQGRLVPMESKNIPLRMAQYEKYHHEGFRLATARRIVENKIRNGRFLLVKYRRSHPEVNLDQEIEHLEAMIKNLSNQNNISSLMGVEGESAATYFQAYGKMFRRELQFTGRNRRPPRDPVNALLSLGYMMLTSEATSTLAAHGLDVYIGFFHEIDYGRPSLALDIIEEFRQPVIDRFVLSLVNRLIFTPEDFEDKGEEGVFLQKDSCKKFFALYDRMMNASFKDKTSDQMVSFRSLITRQTQRIMKCITTGEEYEPYLMMD